MGDKIILWHRGDRNIAMYYKGRCKRSDEGLVGFDVRCRPLFLGPGEYTVTVGGSDVTIEPTADQIDAAHNGAPDAT